MEQSIYGNSNIKYLDLINTVYSSYPPERKRQDIETKLDIGIMGTIEQLSSADISTQPVLSFDWHADREGLCAMGCLDQSVKVGLVTKLKSL
jgi:hypothetical protein